MARRLFGAAIDYPAVRIFNRRYLPFGLQSKNCAMTPNGAIYFHHSCCLLDFSAGSEHARHWFMHEMVDVWQSAHRNSGASKQASESNWAPGLMKRFSCPVSNIAIHCGNLSRPVSARLGADIQTLTSTSAKHGKPNSRRRHRM